MSYPGNRIPQQQHQHHYNNNSNRPTPTRADSIGYASNKTDFDKKAEQAFPAEFHMISGCHDSQTSADVSNLNSQFSLPNPQGRAGGACTAALLSVLYDSHSNGTFQTMSWVTLLRQMRENLLRKGFDQVPQLTSSRLIDVNKPIKLINDIHGTNNGTKRAVMIGINYVGKLLLLFILSNSCVYICIKICIKILCSIIKICIKILYSII